MSDLLGPSGNRMNTLSRLGLLFGATGAGLQGQLPQFQQSLMAQQDAIRQRLQQEQQQQALQALVTSRQIGLAGQAFGGTAPTQQEQSALNLLKAGLPQQAIAVGNPQLANLLKGPQQTKIINMTDPKTGQIVAVPESEAQGYAQQGFVVAGNYSRPDILNPEVFAAEMAKAQAGRSNTNLNVNTAEGVTSGLVKQLPQQLEKDAAVAQSAANLYEQTNTIEGLLNNGIISGTMANPRMAIAKAFATVGLTDGEDVANTEAFISQIGQNVLQLVKGLGAGSGISNADLAFAKQIAGGDIDLSANGIRKVINLTRKASEARVNSFNSRYKNTFENQEIPSWLLDPYRVQLPQVQTQGDWQEVAPGIRIKQVK